MSAPRVPELRPCPKCGLGMARGRGPDGLAYHECLSVSEALRVLQRMAARARDTDGPDLVEAFGPEAMAAAASVEVMHRLVTRDPAVGPAREVLEVYLAHIRAAAGPARPGPKVKEPASGPKPSAGLLAMLKGERPA